MSTAKDLTGMRSGKLVAVKCMGKIGGVIRWLCHCDCGKDIIVRGYSISRGQQKSCGCARGRNLVGQRFGRLVVLRRNGTANDGHIRWLCQCDCGNTTTVQQNNLIFGSVSSCGCIQDHSFIVYELPTVAVLIADAGWHTWIDLCDVGFVLENRWHLDAFGYVVKTTHNIGETGRLQRLLLGVTDPSVVVDHINGDILDNRRSNLRVVTQMQNSWNRLPGKNIRKTRSGTYQVCIRCNNKVHYFGTYPTEAEALAVAGVARQKLFGYYLRQHEGPYIYV